VPHLRRSLTATEVGRPHRHRWELKPSSPTLASNQLFRFVLLIMTLSERSMKIFIQRTRCLIVVIKAQRHGQLLLPPRSKLHRQASLFSVSRLNGSNEDMINSLSFINAFELPEGNPSSHHKFSAASVSDEPGTYRCVKREACEERSDSRTCRSSKRNQHQERESRKQVDSTYRRGLFNHNLVMGSADLPNCTTEVPHTSSPLHRIRIDPTRTHPATSTPSRRTPLPLTPV
jgi:hypothetical protein